MRKKLKEKEGSEWKEEKKVEGEKVKGVRSKVINKGERNDVVGKVKEIEEEDVEKEMKEEKKEKKRW